MIQHQDNSDSIARNARRIKSVELIFLNEQIKEGTISMNRKQPLGSNLYINPQTGEPYYPLFSIPWLDALSLALDKIGIANEPKTDDLPTTAVVVTLADENDKALSEFDSVVAAARKAQSDDRKGNWSFRTFHSSIDSVTIAAEMSETNHFITLFEKREMELGYLVALNNVVSEFYRKRGSR
jgi:hypothetical protein